jgi:hypothetical protein
MTEPKKKPTPEQQNSPAAPDSEETHPNSADAAGFFNRVQRKFKPKDKEKPTHPSEAAEIVIIEEDEGE